MASTLNIKMPGLTVDTSPRAHDSRADSPASPSHSRSVSPVRPPYSPITPTLGSASLATASNGSRPVAQDSAPPRPTYTHSQPHQAAILQPPPVPITFDLNPDALALKSAISILQLQARKAAADIQTLQRIKERALEDAEEFARAVAAGDVKGKSDSLFAPSHDDTDDEDGDDDEELNEGAQANQDGKTWPKLPTPQNIVRCPPINWNKYAVVGESLDKLHADQQARPTEGMPQRLGSDGQLSYGGDGQRRQADLGIAAPFQLGRDRIEKMGTRKGGKR